MDRLTQEFLSKERWEREIDIALAKGIDKKLLKKLVDPEFRAKICWKVIKGEYRILPPRMQLIPKDDGTFRVVYINEDLDRIILSLINNILFDLCPDWISKYCTSYQKGIGTGKVVIGVSNWMSESKEYIKGCKTDLSKYFDTVPIKEIDKVTARLQRRFGNSPIINLLEVYYHQDLCFDLEGKLIEHYQSLKQGCATASFFADVLLYDVDEEMAKIGNYVRYSDDMLFIHPKWKKAKKYLKKALKKKGLTLNPKKVEYVTKDKWIKFLGFSIKGSMISLSKRRIKKFAKDIRRIVRQAHTNESAINAVNKYLYKGYGKEGYCWATSVLSIINSDRDIDELNKWVMDCLRAKKTGNWQIGGIGYEHHEDGVVTRAKGRHVTTNRKKVPYIDGYKSLRCMRNALIIDKAVFDALIA